MLKNILLIGGCNQKYFIGEYYQKTFEHTFLFIFHPSALTGISDSGLVSCLDLISRDQTAMKSLQSAFDEKLKRWDWPMSTLYNILLENPFYRSSAMQIIALDFLYQGDRAHVFLEKIKEKGWITIQTYNRLYTARRAFIGHESYAFCGDRTHPVINITYYGYTLPNIDLYLKNYQLYQQKMTTFQAVNKNKFINDFVSWYDQPKQCPKDSEYERLTNLILPIGISDNGHTHYYATPYGIVSGCIAENRKNDLMNEDYVSTLGPLGLNLITGHKEILMDFIKKQEQRKTATDEKIHCENAVTIDFDNVALPSELKKMTLPGNITLAEALLNLPLEQYLHPII